MQAHVPDRRHIFSQTLEAYLEPVSRYRQDPAVTEIMINGADEVYVERGGRIERTDCRFDTHDLLAMARNLAQYVNVRFDHLTPFFDSRLPDGSRVHVILPRNSRRGLCIAIRQFAKSTFSLEGLVELRTITAEVKEYLELMVRIEQNIIVAGGTGTGKTSFLNALSRAIPSTDRIVVIEDVSELQLAQPHTLRLEATGPDLCGKGAVSVRDLFRSALRMRPDRIVIGECRGGEALDLIQAMTSGHGGSMSTLHASRPEDALRRLETMALMSGVDVAHASVQAQVASAIQLIVQLARQPDGRRVVAAIAEVTALIPGQGYGVNEIFKLGPTPDHSEDRLQFTGITSRFADTLRSKRLLESSRLTRNVFGLNP